MTQTRNEIKFCYLTIKTLICQQPRDLPGKTISSKIEKFNLLKSFSRKKDENGTCPKISSLKGSTERVVSMLPWNETGVNVRAHHYVRLI